MNEPLNAHELYVADELFTRQDLEVMAEAKNYNRWLFDQVRDYIVPGNVLEIGAGVGNLSELLIESKLGQYVFLEPNPQCLSSLKQRFSDDSKITYVQGMFPNLFIDHPELYNGAFTSIVLFNVLEHIENDVAALTVIKQLLKPNGRLLLIVPAFPQLYGEIDERLGHYRRYTKRSFTAALQSTGMKLKKLSYMNMLGAVGWYVNFVVLHRDNQSSAQVKVFDNIVTPIQARVERLVSPPFGQSLVAVAEKMP